MTLRINFPYKSSPKGPFNTCNGYPTYTVFIRIVAAATINFSPDRVRLLFEGGFYSRAALINFD